MFLWYSCDIMWLQETIEATHLWNVGHTQEVNH